MIKKFIEIWNAHKNELIQKFDEEKFPHSNKQVVEGLVELLHEHCNDYSVPDPERIHHIDDGDYQGTDVFVIGGTGYQPHKYWVVKQYYGSCSGCDQLLAISSDYRLGDDEEKKQALKDIEKYTLNILQSMKEI